MDVSVLVRKAEARRESKVEVAPGKTLVLRRPPHLRLVGFRITPDTVLQCIVGWHGMTEADLLGEAVGSSDELPFARELVEPLLADRLPWVELASERLVADITAFIASTEAAAKN